MQNLLDKVNISSKRCNLTISLALMQHKTDILDIFLVML